jgi:hypothetical protein
VHDAGVAVDDVLGNTGWKLKVPDDVPATPEPNASELKAIRDTNFVWLKVNVSKENPNEALLARWPKVAGYPHLFVIDADGRVTQSQDTSVLEAGKNYDRAAFRSFLVDWSPK